MTDLDRRNVAPECAEPEPDAPPRWSWDGDEPTPFQLGALIVALAFSGAGVLVLGYALFNALTR